MRGLPQGLPQLPVSQCRLVAKQQGNPLQNTQLCVEYAGAGVGGTPRGRSSNCE